MVAHGPEHDKKTEFWSTLLGGLDVEIRHVGEALHPHIPEWMKTPTVERLVGLVKGYVQGLHMHGLQGAVVERLTDILDVAFTGGGQSGNHDDKEKKANAWMNAFMADARKRLADAPDKGAMITQLKVELKLYREFYEEATAAKGEHEGSQKKEKSPFEWKSVDDFLGQAAAMINGAVKPPKQNPAPTIGASGLPPIGGSYAAAPAPAPAVASSGTMQFVDTTLGRAHRSFNRGIRFAIITAVAIAALIALSLKWGWAAGIILGIAAFALVPLAIIFMWPTGATVVGLTWAKLGPEPGKFLAKFSGPIRFYTSLIGVLVLFVLLFMWWPIWWRPGGETMPVADSTLWRHTLVLAVIALALLVGSSVGKVIGDLGQEIVGVVIALSLVGLLILFGYWVVTQTLMRTGQSPQKQRSMRTETLTSGGTLTIGADEDVVVIAPARMKAGACIYHMPGVRNFWTSDHGAQEVLISPYCDSRWRAESQKTATRNDGRLLASIGAWNPGGQTATFVIHSRR